MGDVSWVISVFVILLIGIASVLSNDDGRLLREIKRRQYTLLENNKVTTTKDYSGTIMIKQRRKNELALGVNSFVFWWINSNNKHLTTCRECGGIRNMVLGVRCIYNRIAGVSYQLLFIHLNITFPWQLLFSYLSIMFSRALALIAKSTFSCVLWKQVGSRGRGVRGVTL